MRKRSSDSLSFALLGLLAQLPRSGYDLRKLFAESPMRIYSPSPGSIYPALYRLQARGLVRPVTSVPLGGRRRQLFVPTDPGLAELKAWLLRPFGRDEVMRSLDDLHLRFAFIGDVLGPAEARCFLVALERELSAYVEHLDAFYRHARAHMPLCSRLAFECGMEGFRAHAQCAARSIAHFPPAEGD